MTSQQPSATSGRAFRPSTLGARRREGVWLTALALAVAVVGEGCDSADAGSQDGSGSGEATSVGSTTSGGMVDPCADAMTWLTVPVRVHLLRSAIASFDATIDEAGFRAALDEAAADWTQACVRQAASGDSAPP
jgi:hypothetical protein